MLSRGQPTKTPSWPLRALDKTVPLKRRTEYFSKLDHKLWKRVRKQLVNYGNKNTSVHWFLRPKQRLWTVLTRFLGSGSFRSWSWWLFVIYTILNIHRFWTKPPPSEFKTVPLKVYPMNTICLWRQYYIVSEENKLTMSIENWAILILLG